MSVHKQVSKPLDFPFFETQCTTCPNPIYIPGDNHITCSNCKTRLCNQCGLENQKLYGNKYYVACSSLCNQCWSCTSDNESTSSDSSEGYESED